MKIGKNFEIEAREIIFLILFIGSLFAHIPGHNYSKGLGFDQGVEQTEEVCAETINALSTTTQTHEIEKFVNHPNESSAIMQRTINMRVDVLGEERVLGELQ